MALSEIPGGKQNQEKTTGPECAKHALALSNGQGQGNRSTPNIRDPRVNERRDQVATLIHFIRFPTKALPVPIASNQPEVFSVFRKPL